MRRIGQLLLLVLLVATRAFLFLDRSPSESRRKDLGKLMPGLNQSELKEAAWSAKKRATACNTNPNVLYGAGEDGSIQGASIGTSKDPAQTCQSNLDKANQHINRKREVATQAIQASRKLQTHLAEKCPGIWTGGISGEMFSAQLMVRLSSMYLGSEGNCGEQSLLALGALSGKGLNAYTIQMFAGVARTEEHNFVVVTSAVLRHRTKVFLRDLPEDTIVVDPWANVIANKTLLMGRSEDFLREVNLLLSPEILSMLGDRSALKNHAAAMQHLYAGFEWTVYYVDASTAVSTECYREIQKGVSDLVGEKTTTPVWAITQATKAEKRAEARAEL